MELGLYGFGDVQRDPRTGRLGSTADAMRHLLEAITLADEVGLDYFGIGGQVARFAPLADLHRRAAHGARVSAENIKVAIGTPGFIGEDPRAAKDVWFGHWHAALTAVGQIRGFAAPGREHLDRDANGGGALFVGGPEEIAERIVTLQKSVGHVRQFLGMDVGSLPQRAFLPSIELVGTRVKALVDAELGAAQPGGPRHLSLRTPSRGGAARPDTGQGRPCPGAIPAHGARGHDGHGPASTHTQEEHRPMTWQLDPMHTQVEFAAKHFGMMTVRGRFNEVTTSGTVDPYHPEASSIEVVVDVVSLNTHNAQRDNDLRSSYFLELDTYPTITFRSTRIEPAGEDQYRLTGDLTIKGITRPIILRVLRYGEINDPTMGHRVAFSAEGEINRKDFGMSFDMLADGKLIVSHEIKLMVEVEVVEQAQPAEAEQATAAGTA